MAEATFSERVPTLRVVLEIPEIGYRRQLEAFVDTASRRVWRLPRKLLPSDATALAGAPIRLAVGDLRYMPAYLGVVQIGSTRIEFVSVFELGNEPIIGLNIITRFRITTDHAQSISFEP